MPVALILDVVFLMLRNSRDVDSGEVVFLVKG